MSRCCTKCGRGFDQKSWQRESFCGSCGWPLKQLPREEPLEIHPYPDRAHGPVGRRQGLGNTISGIRMFAGQHPFVFGAGVVAGGTGAGIMLLANMLMVAGVMAVLTGSAVAAKAAVEYGVRKRIEQQLREKNLTELIGLSRQLEN